MKVFLFGNGQHLVIVKAEKSQSSSLDSKKIISIAFYVIFHWECYGVNTVNSTNEHHSRSIKHAGDIFLSITYRQNNNWSIFFIAHRHNCFSSLPMNFHWPKKKLKWKIISIIRNTRICNFLLKLVMKHASDVQFLIFNNYVSLLLFRLGSFPADDSWAIRKLLFASFDEFSGEKKYFERAKNECQMTLVCKILYHMCFVSSHFHIWTQAPNAHNNNMNNEQRTDIKVECIRKPLINIQQYFVDFVYKRRAAIVVDMKL